MKIIKKYLLLLLITPCFIAAKGPSDKGSDKKVDSQLGLAAGCTPASSIIFLEFNNVRTRVEAGGLWWQDRANGTADYEIPIRSNSFALYAGGLWLAGTDVNGQLKAAASLFGTDGVDYWAGPLDTNGTAEINEATCNEYDEFFQIGRKEVAEFVAYNKSIEEGTVDEQFPNYQIPKGILDWPGNGDPTTGQDFQLAPYVNVAGGLRYEPLLGDYPFFDLEGDVDCRADRLDRSESSQRPLFGDISYWWIFNDKGNTHTQTNAPSIGMEIHGQAFAFATNDAVNDMTFYNFELINRSTFTLTDTYFASYVDPDLGFAGDDYVGCDVVRGLGYTYNGDEDDEDFRGINGYGTTPAAIGIDFFEGPYQDSDDSNNLVGIGPGEALNGLGYFDPNAQSPDTIKDNERFGMRRFVYYNIGTAVNGDPELAVHFYNYMRGIWKNGQDMVHGGNGLNTAGAQLNLPTAFMFPGESDPNHWGTNGVIPDNTNWTEDNPGGGEPRNDEGDRRFLQSAGPFTLEPGNVNDITVGVVFAQAESGGRLASVEKLFQADDKAQALFDNCFQVLNGPDAPNVEVQELDRELVFYLSNPETSNNEEERGNPYREKDPDIITPAFLLNRTPPVFYDDSFRFQGYQVYQLKANDVSVNDLENSDKARLVFQADIKDGVADLVNYTFDEELGASMPVKKVSGGDEGIRRSFTIKEDLFSTGGSRLVNFKTYYYMAIAYGYNQFKEYAQDVAPDENSPFAPSSDGQTTPYISSRRSATGGSIQPFSAIPHDPLFEQGGTVVNTTYGAEPQITRLQGFGNGGKELDPTQESIDRIIDLRAWEDSTVFVGEIDYESGKGPFEVKVVDPLNVTDGTFYVQIIDDATVLDQDNNLRPIVTDSARWKIWLEGGGPNDTMYSERTIAVGSEQLLFNPNWGLSLSMVNGEPAGTDSETIDRRGFISADITYSGRSEWLSGIPDTDFEGPSNWIVAGTFTQGQVTAGGGSIAVYNDNRDGTDGPFYDPDEDFEGIIEGTIAPYQLVRYIADPTNPATYNAPGYSKGSTEFSGLDKLSSLVLVFTSDKSKWTRCPVVDTDDTDQDPSDGKAKNFPKTKLSVDKEGNPVDTTGRGGSSFADIERDLSTDTDENDAGFISAVGMGWFPGYALNKETGERLSIAFGEDSKYSFNNGNDMLWNPTETVFQGVGAGIPVFGGKHFIYIFRNMLESEREDFNDRDLGQFELPAYNNGKNLLALLRDTRPGRRVPARNYAWGLCSWVANPILAEDAQLLSSDVRIDINLSAPFGVQESNIADELDNDGKPVYRFETSGLAPAKNQTATLSDALEQLNVVPNPYYAASQYELTELANTVKLTNLPEVCNITIYNTNGTLIRSYKKANPLNFLDWDLKNQANIPISSGVYLIHIEVPGVGEKILKWFGVMRPVDLNNF